MSLSINTFSFCSITERLSTIVFIGPSRVENFSVINYIIVEEKQRTNFISYFNNIK